jgi:hypothetical protein
MDELINGPLSEDTVSEHLDAWADQVEGVVAEASALYPREPTVAAFRAEIETLKATLVRRRAEVLPQPVDDASVPEETPDGDVPDAATATEDETDAGALADQ